MKKGAKEFFPRRCHKLKSFFYANLFMPLRKLFWFLSGLLIVFLALQVLGFNMLIPIISLLFVDLVVVELSRQDDRDRFRTELKHELVTRIGNIERILGNILENFSHIPTTEHVHSIAEERIEAHKISLREEFKNDLDMIAKKAIEIENRLHDLRHTIASGIGSLDDRLRAIEQESVERIREVEVLE